MRWAACAAVLAIAGTNGTAGWVLEGNSAFNTERLLQALTRYDLPAGGAPDVTTADDAAFFLREFYFAQGFPDADVTYDFQPGQAILRITEGDRLWIGRVEFQGASLIPPDRLQTIFQSAVRNATRAPFGRLRFVASAVDDAADRIRLAYVAEGFSEAAVSVETQPSADFKTTDIRILIEPGLQHFIRRVRVEGAEFSGVAELERRLEEFAGRPFRPQDEALVRSRAVDFLRSNGFYFATVETTAGTVSPDGRLDLIVRPRPGRKMTFGSVTASGWRTTREAALLRRFGIRPGRTFDAAALDRAERRLWFSGAFSGIDVETVPRRDGTVDVHARVSEADARSLSATLGYSQWFLGFATASFTDRNFLGSLNRLAVSGFVSQKSFGGEISYSDPWLFGSDVTGSLEAFAQRAELPAFRATQFGGRARLSGKESERRGTGWGLAYEWKDVTNARIYSEDNEFEDYRLGIITFRQELDRRNDPAIPMSGYDLRYSAGLAAAPLAGNLTFFKATAQGTWYVPLQKISADRPFVPFLTLNHRAGVIVPLAGTDSIPVPERFFLGGPDSVRSFQFDGMAPRDSQGIPLGGEAFLQANVELQWPVGRGFFAAAFTDFGNLASDLDAMQADQTRIAPGAGIRLYTPLGAFRIDYAYNLVRKDGDPLGAWQFGLGVTF